jgi:hypothetical protein
VLGFKVHPERRKSQADRNIIALGTSPVPWDNAANTGGPGEQRRFAQKGVAEMVVEVAPRVVMRNRKSVEASLIQVHTPVVGSVAARMFVS